MNLFIPIKALTQKPIFSFHFKHTSLLLVLLGLSYFSKAQDKDEEIGKFDRIDLAMKQEFEMTKDPKLNIVPRAGLLGEMERVKFRATNRSVTPITWNERGPDNVGGRTRAILVDRTNPNNVFAGSVSGGLWRINNVASATPTWTQVNDFFNNLAVSCIAQSPVNSGEMYFGTGEGYYYSSGLRGMGIWKSTNSGTNWAQLASTNNNPDFYFVNKIAITQSGVILAGTGNNGSSGTGNIMRSLDGGITWNVTLGIRTHDLEIAANGHIYAACMNVGIYKSVDNGATWVLQTGSGLPTSGFGRIELATAASDANTVYAIYDKGYNNQEIYNTSNGGASWVLKTTPSVNGNTSMAEDQGWYDLIAAVDPNNPNRVFAGGKGLYVTNDGGTSWTHLGGSYNIPAPNKIHSDQHMIVFPSNTSTTVYFGNDGGIFRSINATATVPTVTAINKGYNVTQYYSTALHPAAGSNFFLAGAQDNGTQRYATSGINTTKMATGADGGFCHIDQDNPKILITSFQNNQIHVSKDSGATWTYIGGTGGHFINPTDYADSTNVLYTPFDGGVVNEIRDIVTNIVTGHDTVAPSKYLYVTGVGTSNSLHYVEVPQFKNSVPTAVKVSPNVPNRVYFGLENGQLVRLDNANSSSPTVTVLGKPTTGWISCIEVKDSNENHMIMTYSNYGVQSVWSSLNGGVTWQSVEGNLPNMPVRWAIFAPDTTGKVLIATELGVWMNDILNGALTVWAPINTGLPNVRVDMLQSRKKDKLVAAATHGRGLYTTTSFFAPSGNCQQPTGLVVTELGATAASLVWDFVPAAMGYTVQYRRNVAAISAPSGPRTSRIPADDPNIRPIETPNGRLYAWNNELVGSGGGVAGILDEPWTTVTVTNNSAEITGLTVGTSYEFQVQSICNGAPSSLYADPKNFTTTGVPTCGKIPTSLGVSKYSYYASTTFYWGAETDVKGYIVEWRKAGSTDPWTFDFSPYSDYDRSNIALTLLPDTDYEFRVKSVCNNDIESDPSAVKTFRTLAAPCGTQLTLALNTAFSNAALLTWNAAYTEGYVFAYRKVGDAAWLYRSFSNLTSLELDGLLPTTAYECKIKTTCKGGVDIYSNLVTFTTKAVACNDDLVKGLTISNLTATTATISWDAVPNASGYTLEIFGLKNAGGGSITFLETVPTNTYNLTILPNTDTWNIYDYRVKPICPSGTNYTPVTRGFTIGNTCANGIPLMDDMQATVTSNSARIHWGKTMGATQYIIRFRPASFGNNVRASWVDAGTTANEYYDLTGLNPHTTYDYTIIACSAAGSYWYFVFRTITTADAVPPCGIPSTLTATNITGQSAKITWAAITGATYALEYKTTTATTWTTVSGLSTNTYDLSVLTPLTPYNVRVRTDCSTTAIDGYISIDFTTFASLSLKAFLEGPFDVTTGKMKDNLRSAGILASSVMAEPYTGLGFIHKGGGGGETVNSTVFNTTGDNAIVDWVFIELRDAITPATVLYTRSALIQVDGDIVDVDGVSPLSINAPAGNYYVAISHRNHLSIQSSTPITFSLNTLLLDFSDKILSISLSKMNELNNLKVIRAGDVNRNGAISAFDILQVRKLNVTGQSNSYKTEDVNMTGQVTAFDILMTRKNNKTN
jgi:Dockerin type I domain